MYDSFLVLFFNLGLLLARSLPSNILIIVADDLGWNDVSWHNDVVQTPNLEELAMSGILLEQHYSQPICTPTRAALLTSRQALKLDINYSEHTLSFNIVKH